MIKFPCPHCSANNEAEDIDAGQLVLCGHCNGEMHVPAQPVIRQAIRPAPRPAAPRRMPEPAQVAMNVRVAHDAQYGDEEAEYFQHPHSGYRLDARTTPMAALFFICPPWFAYRYRNMSMGAAVLGYPILLLMLSGLFILGVLCIVEGRPSRLAFWLTVLGLHMSFSLLQVSLARKHLLMEGWKLV